MPHSTMIGIVAAMAKGRRTTGRVTPKGTRPAGARTPPRPPDTPAPPPGQVGRRPSRPGFLLAVGGAWIVVGVVILTTLDAGWRIIPGVVAIGIGLFFVRGAAVTVLRREGRL